MSSKLLPASFSDQPIPSLAGGNNWWLWWILSLCSRARWIRLIKTFPRLWERRFCIRFSLQFHGFISSGVNLNVCDSQPWPSLNVFCSNRNVCNVLQKTNIIRDYLEDINEVPKCRMFWPRQIWSKYVDKLEVFFFNSLTTHLLSHIFLPFLIKFMILNYMNTS